MNMEIKFRAWDSRENRFVYKGFYDRNWYFHQSECWHWKRLVPEDKHYQHLEKYTGLKDMKGVEIYEGDIVRILYTDWPSRTDFSITLDEYKKSISSYAKVVYKAPEFKLLISCGGYGCLNPGKHGEMEVIGNIHQNPELLDHNH